MKYLIGASLQFRDFLHYCPGRKHGNINADMVLERYLRVLQLEDKQQEENETLGLT